MIRLHRTTGEFVTVPQGCKIILLSLARDVATGEVRSDVIAWREPFRAGLDEATEIVVPWRVD